MTLALLTFLAWAQSLRVRSPGIWRLNIWIISSETLEMMSRLVITNTGGQDPRWL